MLKILKKTPQKIRILAGPFKGAFVYLNPSNSKRKIFGVYEKCLNQWISQVVPKKDFAIDVGANSGYDTYGFAHLLSKKNTRNAHVISIEPEASNLPELMEPQKWAYYSNTKFTIIEKFAGSQNSNNQISLDSLTEKDSTLQSRSGIVKIDVEGAEIDVLKGSQKLLSNPNIEWLIEIHGKDLINPVTKFFNEISRPYLIKELHPIPFIGIENRPIQTYWLVTI